MVLPPRERLELVVAAAIASGATPSRSRLCERGTAALDLACALPVRSLVIESAKPALARAAPDRAEEPVPLGAPAAARKPAYVVAQRTASASEPGSVLSGVSCEV